MAKPRKAPLWRGRFLRALARTGTVAASAEMAGVDKSTVYLRRKWDRDFARRWERAKAKGKERAAWKGAPPPHCVRSSAGSIVPPSRSRIAGGNPSRRSPGNPGEDLVLRKSKRGAQLIRAGEGRWSPELEDAFCAHYTRCGCIRWAARAVGISANSVHTRKKNYPDFAARMAACAAAADDQLRDYVRSAGLATFDPELPQDETPKVSISEAISILRLKGSGKAAEEPVPLPPIEEVRDEVLRRIAAIRRHREGDSSP